MLTTGMLMFGKMSVGVRKMESVPRIKIRIAITTNVYGRFSATLTIHIIYPSGLAELQYSNRPYVLCLGVLASKVEISCSAAGGTATVPDRTMSLAGIFLPYRRRLSPLSGRIVEPSRETPANKPRALE